MKATNSLLKLADLNSLFNQAWAEHQNGRLFEAKAIYEQLLQKMPNHSEALHLLGIIALDQNNPALAIDHITKSIESNPKQAAAFASLGKAMHAINRPDDAINCYDLAIGLRPDFTEVHYNKANLLQTLNRLDDAIASYEEAIAHKPQHASAFYNRGQALLKLSRLKDAVQSYDAAIAIKNDHAEAFSGRGLALLGLNQIQDGIDSFNNAIKFNPFSAEAQWNKSIALLHSGDFPEGWKLYEWRWQLKDFQSPNKGFNQPLWLGKESLNSKVILLQAEQGYGDTIQFCRFAAKVKEMGATVYLEAPKQLINLLENLEGIDQLIESGTALPPFDFHCPLLSLPLALQITIDSIPFANGYLNCNSKKLEKWRTILGPKVKPRIGLAWSGNTAHKNDQARSLKLAEIINYLPPEFDLISLQKEVRAGDQVILENSHIKHFGEHLHDFSDTASLCELMDIIVSVDTSVAHLAAALGKKTSILLPFPSDWRWLFDFNKTDSPWYRNVKLYRQDTQKLWAPVLDHLKNDLQLSATQLNAQIIR